MKLLKIKLLLLAMIFSAVTFDSQSGKAFNPNCMRKCQVACMQIVDQYGVDPNECLKDCDDICK